MQKTVDTRASQRKVFVIGEHGTLSASLANLLREETESDDCGEAMEARQAIEVILHAQPDMLVMDMPKARGTWTKLIKEVKAAKPQIKVLAVCGEDDPRTANRVLRAGADGYVLSQEEADELRMAIQDVLAGMLRVSDQVVAGSVKPKRPANARFSAVLSASRTFWNSFDWARATLKSPVGSI